MRWLPLVVVLGCRTAPFFAPADPPACEVDVAPYDEGPYAFLVAASDAGVDDGGFDVDPAGPLAVRAVGAYDLATGAFAWETTFADGFRQKREIVEGEGTVAPDGDVDLVATVDRRLVAARQSVQTVRVRRTGCEVRRQVTGRSGEVLNDETGTIEADGYRFVRTRQVDTFLVEVTGERRADGSSTESEAWRRGAYQIALTREDDGAGEVVTTFDEVDDGIVREGRVVLTFEGAERRVYTEVDGGTTSSWRLRIEPDGTGTGEVEVRPDGRDPYTCTVVIEGAECVRSCEDRPDLACTVGGP